MFEFGLSQIHAKLSLRLFIFNGVIVAWRVLRIIGSNFNFNTKSRHKLSTKKPFSLSELF